MIPPTPPIFRSATAPWLLELVATRDIADSLAWKAAAEGITARVVRGAKMKRTDELYDEFAAALQFPYYFGANGGAFDECLTDLEWLPGTAYLIVVAQADAFLVDEDDEQLRLFIDAFERAAEQWATPVELGEDWDHPAIPFHVVFQFDAEAAVAGRKRFAAAGAELRSVGTWTPYG